MAEFRKGLLSYFESRAASLIAKIEEEGAMSDEDKEFIVKTAEEYRDQVYHA